MQDARCGTRAEQLTLWSPGESEVVPWTHHRLHRVHLHRLSPHHFGLRRRRGECRAHAPEPGLSLFLLGGGGGRRLFIVGGLVVHCTNCSPIDLALK